MKKTLLLLFCLSLTACLSTPDEAEEEENTNVTADSSTDSDIRFR